MSQCDCKDPRNFRITSEKFEDDSYRIRCVDCGGKWGTINIEEIISFLK